MPNIAVSRPSGYGPLRAFPLTKWRVAVGIAVGRPGSASPGPGIASFFLVMNMGNLSLKPRLI